MSHIAASLEKFQGESTTESYFGVIQPCLFAVQRKLDCIVTQFRAPRQIRTRFGPAD